MTGRAKDKLSDRISIEFHFNDRENVIVAFSHRERNGEIVKKGRLKFPSMADANDFLRDAKAFIESEGEKPFLIHLRNYRKELRDKRKRRGEGC